MKRLGEVLHLSSSRNLIVKTKDEVLVGSRVFDSKLRQMGTVFDVFGPVSSPYVSVKPVSADPHSLVGKVLYVNDNSH